MNKKLYPNSGSSFRNLFCLLSAFLFINASYGQDIDKLKKNAQKALSKGRLDESLGMYDQVLSIEKKDAEAMFYKGYILLQKKEYTNALNEIERAGDLAKNAYHEYYYTLGFAQHKTGKFADALASYNHYMTQLDVSDQTERDLILKLILEVKTGMSLELEDQEYTINNMGPAVNTIHAEHSPVISSDGNTFIFTSVHEIARKNNHHDYEEYWEDIFQMDRKAGEWSLPMRINHVEDDASVQLFDQDRKLLILRRASNGHLLVSQLSDTKRWMEPEPIKGINSPYIESHGFMSEDGRTIIFSSNRDTEYGDLDLYYSIKLEDGKWSKPESLGENVNTHFDEDSPYITRDGSTLYFSSKGHNSIGGFDIFKSSFDFKTKVWGPPVNLGLPINTPDDEVSFTITSDGSEGYLSSNRAGGFGSEDIYHFKKKEAHDDFDYDQYSEIVEELEEEE